MKVLDYILQWRGVRSLRAMVVLVVFAMLAMIFILSRVDNGRVAPAPVVSASIEPVEATPEIAVTTSMAPAPARELKPKIVSPDAFFEDLRDGFDPDHWWPSTHGNTEPGIHYGGPWKRENIAEYSDRLSLKIVAGSETTPPTMAEMKTKREFWYGRYEVIMQPSGEGGTVSAFFTYTGPWAGNPHDEVDIEFLGRHRDEVEFNYFKNGNTGNSSRYKLGFNPSESMNLYAFEWRPSEIIWYINDEEVYRTPSDSFDIPTNPSNLFLSAWTGAKNIESWVGPARFGDAANADFACVSFTPFSDKSYTCSDLFAEDPQFQTN